MPPSGGAARHSGAVRGGDLRAASGAHSAASGSAYTGSSYSGSSYYSESLAPPLPPPPQPKPPRKPLLSWFRRSNAAAEEAAPAPAAQDVAAPDPQGGELTRTPRYAELGGPVEVQTRPDWPPLPTPEDRAAALAAAEAAAEAKSAEEAKRAAAQPALALSMRARGRPDDGHLTHVSRAEREEAEAKATAEAEAVAAAEEAAAAVPPPPKATEVVADFIANSEVIAETNAKFTSACEACRALQAALTAVGPACEGFTEVVVAREALSGALSTRRSSAAPFSGADAEVCPPLLPVVAAATARCEAALDRSAVRVVRGAEVRALWRAALGSAPDSPWPVFATGLQAFLRAAPEPRARFVLERVSSPSGDARLRWHVDRGNSDAVSTAAVDAAFPPDEPLLARLEAMLDAAPDKALPVAALRTTLPPRAPPASLAPREAPVGALGDRLLSERGLRGLALVGGAGMGKTSLAVEEAHALLAAGRLPGGAYFADLRSRASRAACGAAVQLALGAPPLGGTDPEGAALAVLRQAGKAGAALLILDGADAALAEGSGGDFYALLARILSCGAHVRLLVTSRAPVESGLAGLKPHRVGALPLKACIDALAASFPPHAELSDPSQSRHFAKEAAQLAGRAPLALALNAATLAATPVEARGAAVGTLLHALRVARGVRFEGADTGSACVNCALTNPWDHVIEFLAPSAYYDTANAARIAAAEEAALAAAAAGQGSAMPLGPDASGDATVAGLKLPEYEAAIKACAATAWASLPPVAAAAAASLSVFPASFDVHAAMAVLAEAPNVPATEGTGALEVLVARKLLSYDARAGRYSMASLVRKAMGETPLGPMALHAASLAFVRYYTAQCADAEADAAAGQPAAGLYETDREWHNLFWATSPWGLAGGADAELAAAIAEFSDAHARVVGSRAKPSDRPMDVDAGDTAAQVASLTAAAEELASKGSYDESLKAYQDALDLQVQAAGGYDASLAATHSAMAFIRSSACDDAAAVRDLQRALAIQTLALGPSHPDLGATLVDLACAQRKTGQLDEAAASARRALQLLADGRGEEHVDVAVAYNELGNAYKAQGLLAEALDSYRLSLRIREVALGPKALDVANSLWNIACCYELQERYGDANSVLVRAVRIYQAELGPDHEETLEATKFAARMGEAKRVAKGGDEPWKSDHKGHPWNRMNSGP